MPRGQGHRALAGEEEVRPVFRKDPCRACGEWERMAVGRVPGASGRRQALGVDREGIWRLEVGPVTCFG